MADGSFFKSKMPLLLKKIWSLHSPHHHLWNRSLRSEGTKNDQMSKWANKFGKYLEPVTSKLQHIVEAIKKLNLSWAGHQAPPKDNYWTMKSTKWTPHGKKRKWGKQKRWIMIQDSKLCWKWKLVSRKQNRKRRKK